MLVPASQPHCCSDRARSTGEALASWEGAHPASREAEIENSSVCPTKATWDAGNGRGVGTVGIASPQRPRVMERKSMER